MYVCTYVFMRNWRNMRYIDKSGKGKKFPIHVAHSLYVTGVVWYKLKLQMSVFLNTCLYKLEIKENGVKTISPAIDNKRTKAPENFDEQGQRNRDRNRYY